MPVARLLAPRLRAGERRARDAGRSRDPLAARVDGRSSSSTAIAGARHRLVVEVAGREALLARPGHAGAPAGRAPTSRAAQCESSASPPDGEAARRQHDPVARRGAPRAARPRARTPSRARPSRSAPTTDVVEDRPARRRAAARSRRIANTRMPGHRRRQRRHLEHRAGRAARSSVGPDRVRVGDPQHRRERDALAGPEPRRELRRRPRRGTPGRRTRARSRAR